MRKHPIVIGLCNAVIPGLGYLLSGERKVFGWLLIAGVALYIVLSVIEPSFLPTSFFVSQSALGKLLESLMYLSFVGAFGYDAWDLANEKRQGAQLPMIVSSPS
jgi:hypothetical protein